MKYNKLSLQGLYLILSGPAFWILLILLQKILPTKVFHFISYGLSGATGLIINIAFMVVIPIWAIVTAIRSSTQIGKLKKLSIENQTTHPERGHVLNLITILLSILTLFIGVLVFFGECPPSARCKTKESAVQAQISNMRAQAELYLQTKGMYAKQDNITSCDENESVFNDAVVGSDLSRLLKDIQGNLNVKKVSCFASTTGWSVAVEMKTKPGTKVYICSDSNGNSITKYNLSGIEEIQNQAVGCIVK